MQAKKLLPNAQTQQCSKAINQATLSIAHIHTQPLAHQDSLLAALGSACSTSQPERPASSSGSARASSPSASYVSRSKWVKGHAFTLTWSEKASGSKALPFTKPVGKGSCLETNMVGRSKSIKCFLLTMPVGKRSCYHNDITFCLLCQPAGSRRKVMLSYSHGQNISEWIKGLSFHNARG
eukprot:1162147-Pelagomonas_calceolata.AAC.9